MYVNFTRNVVITLELFRENQINKQGIYECKKLKISRFIFFNVKIV